MKETLAVFEGYQGITRSLDKLVFRTPSWPFYHRWALFEEAFQRQKLEDPESVSYTQLLYDVLDDDLRPVRAEVDIVTSQGLITCPLLWAIIDPGTCVISAQQGKADLFFLVESFDCQKDRLDDNLTFVDWDGSHLG